MLKILLKKQLLEINKGLFVSQKQNKARSKGEIAFAIIGYAILVLGVLGGMFGFFSYSICQPLVGMGYGWLYFLLSGLMALVIGLFASVFNTYGSLYAAKDNDLLLSLPVPVKAVIISRLSAVYLLGLGFSAVTFIPSGVVYFIYYPFELNILAGLLVAILSLSILILALSCLLGALIARIATKIKNKTFVSVVSILAFFVIYYVFYFKATEIMQNIVDEADNLAATLEGTSQAFYQFGQMCMGSWSAIGMFLLASAVILVLLIRIIARSFITLATATASSKKKDVRLKTLKVKGVKSAIYGKEIGRLLSSTNYIINCCLGVILIPAVGVLALIYQNDLDVFFQSLGLFSDLPTAIIVAGLCMLTSTIDPATPSVSLEGKTHWISQSLPVDPWIWLKQKFMMEWTLSSIPTLFTQICILIALKPTIETAIILLVVPQIYVAFSSIFDLYLGVKSANYNWTNEIYPIKQNYSIFIAIFSGWVFAAAFAALAFLLLDSMSLVLYVAIWSVLLVILAISLLNNIKKEGTASYAVNQ